MERGRGRGRVRPVNNAPDPGRAAPSQIQQTGSSAQNVLQHDIFAPSPAPTAAPAAKTTPVPATASYLERATRAPTAGKYKPKKVRRDDAARELLASQEAEKDALKRAAEARQRGRFRGGRRSRGSMMSRGGLDRSNASAFPAGGDWKTKAEGAPGFQRTGSRKYEGGVGSYGYHSNQRPRINADRLNVQEGDGDAEEDDEGMLEAMGSSRAGTVWPMGIYRKEHKEIEFTVATTAELEAQERDAKAEAEAGSSRTPGLKQEDVVDDNRLWHAAPRNLASVKQEPDEPTIIDFDQEMKNPLPRQPESTQAQGAKILKPGSQDAEEDIEAADLRLLAEELGLASLEEPKPDADAAPGAEPAKPIEAVKDKDGRLYLFQLPPLLPPLRVLPKTDRPDAVAIKPEPDDVVMLGSVPGAASQPSDPFPSQLVDSSQTSNGGIVGVLNVRRSGKVEVDWGGTVLEMCPATGLNFVTTAVIVEDGDEKPKAGSGVSGQSVGMGRVMGRFVLSPVWGEEDDWDVAPEDLEAEVETTGGI